VRLLKKENPNTRINNLVKKSRKDKRKNALEILEEAKKLYPWAECALVHKDALQLLVATILSAQCTDERVNKVTKKLFKKYRTVNDFTKVTLKELGKDIRPTGYYNSKAKYIKGACKMIVDEYRGIVPDNMEELVKLPGVGRKTASVVLGVIFGKAEGVVVDTHVFRISKRLGLSKGKSPGIVERDLMKILPNEYWIDWADHLIWHGRRVCDARKPLCGECTLEIRCPKVGVKTPSR